MGAVFHQAGFSTNSEPPNIFHGKVPGENIERCLNHYTTRDTIIHNLLIHDFLANANGIGARNMAAVFGVKTLRLDKKKLYVAKKLGKRDKQPTGRSSVYKEIINIVQKKLTSHA